MAESERAIPIGDVSLSNAGLSLRSNFVWTLAGNVVYAGSQWALLVAIAKLGSPGDVGQFALGLAITGPLFVLSQLQLRAVQATDARAEFVFGDYLGLRLITTAAALLLTAAIAFPAGRERSMALTIFFIGLSRAFESVSDVFYGVQQQRERLDRIAIAQMLRGPLSVIAFAAGFWATGSVACAALGLAVAAAVMLACYDSRLVALSPWGPSASGKSALREALRIDWRPSAYATLFKTALPLGVVLMFCSLTMNMPRYFIGAYDGAAALGIFAAISYLMALGNTIIGACGQAATPRLAKYHAAVNVRAFYGLVWQLAAVGVACGAIGVIVAMAAGKEILAILYRPEYASHGRLLVMICCVALLNYVGQFLGCAITAARVFNAQVPLFAIVTAATAAACWILIPIYGLAGAALAMGAGNVVQVVGSLVVLVHSMRKARARRQLYGLGVAGRSDLKPEIAPFPAGETGE